MNCHGEVSKECGCIKNGRNIINEIGEPHRDLAGLGQGTEGEK